MMLGNYVTKRDVTKDLGITDYRLKQLVSIGVIEQLYSDARPDLGKVRVYTWEQVKILKEYLSKKI